MNNKGWKLFATCLLSLCLPAAAHAQSVAPIKCSMEFEGVVSAIVVQPDGKMVVGGNFSSVNGTRRDSLVRLNADGTVDPTWAPTVDGQVFALALIGANIYVGGLFTHINGQPHRNLAKLDNVTGAVDASWTNDTSQQVYALAAEAVNLVVGGFFSTIGGQHLTNIACIVPATGKPDTNNWIHGANREVYALYNSGGFMYAAGSFTNIGGQNRKYIAKLNVSDGTSAVWNPGANASVQDIYVDGTHVYACGTFTNIGSRNRRYLGKIPIGSDTADASWDPNPDDDVTALAGDTANVYAGGSFTNIGGRLQRNVAKLGKGGTGAASNWVDTAISRQFFGIQCLNLSGTNLYVGGDFATIGGLWALALAKLDITTGAKDPASPICVARLASADALARQDDGKVLLGGNFLAVNGRERWGLARIHPDGSLDTNWTADTAGSIYALAAQGTNLYVGGFFTNVGGVPRRNLAKLHYGTGTPLAGWTNDAPGTVYNLAGDTNWLYVTGNFDVIGGQGRTNLARIGHAVGQVDPAWAPNPNLSVQGIVLDGANVYVGGSFTRIGGQNRDRLAKLNNTSGAADAAWNPGADGYVYSLAVNSSAVFAAGEFGMIGGQSRDYVAKLNKTDGNADPAWNAQCGNYAEAVAADEAHVYVGGDFTEIGQTNYEYLARLNTTSGGADLSWHVTPDNSISENGLKLFGSDLYAGGSFSEVNGLWRPGFVVIQPFGFRTVYRDGIMGAAMTWRSRSNYVYDVEYSTNLVQGFRPLVHDIWAAPEENTFVDVTFSGEPRVFYKVIEKPQ